MSENNTEGSRKRKKKNLELDFRKSIKIFFSILLIVVVIAGGALGGIVLSMVKSSPDIDPSQINSNLSHTSSILDLDGNLIEKIETAEFRTFVSINKTPQHLQDAFIAIEDERFYDHRGVDPRGIVASFFENIRADGIVRGASTITQQLVKNVYLSPEKKYSRKIQEAYLALKVDKALSKNQILEAYMNRNFFGQNAYGVQEAAQTYFSKDVGDLTIAESAIIAGIVKNIQTFQPYYRVRPEDFDSSKHYEVGEIDVLGEKYVLVFNEQSVERQRVILKKMLELGKIDQAEYEQALEEDIKESLKPGQKKTSDITSYFTDYVKTEVIDNLVYKQGYTKEQAEELVFAGGLQIYTTVDLDLQKQLEGIYENFVQVLSGNIRRGAPNLIRWKLVNGNIVDPDHESRILFYKESNLLNDDFGLVIEKGTYEILDNGDLEIKNSKMNPYQSHIDIADYYRIDDKNNLVTHTVGSIMLGEDQFTVDDQGLITISKDFIESSENFYTIDDTGNLIINERFFYRSKDGVVQPQSASVILDYRTGHIKALVGGRDVEGSRILNRAIRQRQPGSAIKPIATYLPALDNGYTAGTALDDLPHFDSSGKEKPKNWTNRYDGIHTLRRAVEQSINTISYRTVENIGVNNIKTYLEKMGIIDSERPESDSFVTRDEKDNPGNRGNHDEDISPLALGGMTRGLTPLELTAAYGTIANGGVHIEPIPFTKVLDRDGNVLIDNTPRETVVVSPQIAYIMQDILRTTITNGLARRANVPGLAVAGKTGTTQKRADVWFVGFTPYYATGLWIGNDLPMIRLTSGSTMAAQLWKHITEKVHSDLKKIPSFSRPDGIISVNICTQSGLLPTELCKEDPRHVIKSEIFAKGTEPRSHCDVHVEALIDTSTGKLANEFCPEEDVETRIFIERRPAYNPKDNKNIIPTDYKYTLPTEVCDKHDPTTVVEEDDDGDDDTKDPGDDLDLPEKPDNGGNGDNDDTDNGNDQNDNDGNEGDNDRDQDKDDD